MVQGDIKNGVRSAGGSHSPRSGLHSFYESVCLSGWAVRRGGRGGRGRGQNKEEHVRLSPVPTLMMWGPSVRSCAHTRPRSWRR